ncbi:hypothetical protein H4218_001101 [Coemansia sp. IMI 209128]|nr:hypothetical protein GGI10_001793 [Coemansia sp. RSA 2530]KAJ2702014.1 hypothetical protein H4218_001101 [Coemansia sp. IMI 209128]
MRHNEGFDRSHTENIDSNHYGFVANQPGNEVGQQQDMQQYAYSQQHIQDQQNVQNLQHTYSQPNAPSMQRTYSQQNFQNQPLDYSQQNVQNQPLSYSRQYVQNPQQSFCADYKQGPGYSGQPPNQGFQNSPVPGPAWNYNQSGRADELDEGYASGGDGSNEYGGERGFGEVKDKFMGKFVDKDEYGNNVYDKTNIALAAAAVVAVAVGTAAVVKNGFDVKRARDDEQRDYQIGGGSQHNDTYNGYPPASDPYNTGPAAHPNDSGYYGST